jgi:transposase
VEQEKKMNKYTDEFKLKAVKMYLNGDGGYKAITKKLKLPDPSYIKHWVKNYKIHGVVSLKAKQKLSNAGKKEPIRKVKRDDELLRLQAENEYLKKLLILDGWDVSKDINLK